MTPLRVAKIKALSIAWQVVDCAASDIMMELDSDNDAQDRKIRDELNKIAQSLFNRMSKMKEADAHDSSDRSEREP